MRGAVREDHRRHARCDPRQAGDDAEVAGHADREIPEDPVGPGPDVPRGARSRAADRRHPAQARSELGRHRQRSERLAPGGVGTLFVNATELERFIEARAIVLPEPFNGETCALEPLEPLRRRLRSAGLVMLGETNHFIHEKSDFRLLLSRVLMSEGWSCFLEELGHCDGIRVNRFLQSGDERELEHLPSFGYTAHLRSDRDDRPGGILKSESYPTEAFLWEQKRFYSGLRSEVLRKGGEVHLAGIDIDGLPGGSYEDIADLIPAMATKLHP